MKKILAGLIALMMLAVVGCTPVPPETNTPPVPDESKVAEISEQTTTTTTTTKDSTTKKRTPAKPTGSNIKTTSSTKAKPKYISKDKAKAVAFERAGVKAKDVTRLQIELDYDDDRRIWEYEIDFRVGKMEYDVSVNAVIGTITSFEKELDVND